MTTIRDKQIILDWFNSFSLEQKFYKTIEANSVLEGDSVDNHPDRLTEEQIILVYTYHETHNLL